VDASQEDWSFLQAIRSSIVDAGDGNCGEAVSGHSRTTIFCRSISVLNSRRVIPVTIYGYLVLAVGWLGWMTPFFLIKRTGVNPQRVDRRARWGIVLQGIGYSLLWQTRFWERSTSGWQVFASASLFSLAAVLSWSGARALGRQWRFDAGLNRDHELIRSGPYRVVRHPLYASMLCLLLGTGLLITPWPLLALSVLPFLIGTEIRIRIEDQLLASSFGDQFAAYRRATPAYIPFVR